MTFLNSRRALAALAIPALGLGLAACGSDEPDGANGGSADNDAVSPLSAQEAVLASIEDLDDSSYKMESTVAMNGLEYMAMTGTYDGENSQASADIFMSTLMELSGEELTAEEQEAMEAMFGDMHTETVVIGDVLFMQMSGGMFDAMAETYGDDAWFTMELTEDEAIGDIYAQYGGMDLAEQTEMILGDLDDVEETSAGVYTGTLSADSESMAAFTEAAGSEGSELVDGTEVTVTLDGDGLLKSMTMDLPEYQGMAMSMSSEIVEIGGDYDIAAPTTDNLHDFEEFVSALSGGM